MKKSKVESGQRVMGVQWWECITGQEKRMGKPRKDQRAKPSRRWNRKDMEADKNLASVWPSQAQSSHSLVSVLIYKEFYSLLHIWVFIHTSMHLHVPTHMLVHICACTCTHAPSMVAVSVCLSCLPRSHSEKQPPSHLHLGPHPLCPSSLGQLTVSPIPFPLASICEH